MKFHWLYDYFVAESKRGAPFYSWKYSNKRAAHCLNISLDSNLRKIIKAMDESKPMELPKLLLVFHLCKSL
jgi:hypothetical protein